MSTVSLTFLLFVAAGLLLYYLVPKKLQWVLLLVLSYIFYLSGGVSMAGYLLFTTLSTYLAALYIGRENIRLAALSREEREKVKKAAGRRKKLVCALAIVLNFGLLYFLKYWNFTADLLGEAFSASLPRFDLVLPLAISFYMFQSVGYLLDVYRGKYPAQRNVCKYALFVSFFPQMVQGPIGRYDALAPQLLGEHQLDFDNLKAGIQLMVWGYFKKLLIADRAAVVANQVFGNFEEYGGTVILFGVILYSIQLYCDFSGGIDIIRGAAKLFGIDMAENFRQPFFAVSLTDFWRRWHISLGTWMKDYLFYSISFSKPVLRFGKFTRRKIGGRLGKILPTSIATFTIYLVIGIWHGASWKFIAFGLWNGVLITSALLLEPIFEKVKQKLHIKDKSGWFHAFRVLRTTVIILIGRYLTRADGFLYAVDMLKKTLLHPIPSQIANGELMRLGLQMEDYLVIVCGMALLLLAEYLRERGKSLGSLLDRAPRFCQVAVMAAGFICILWFGIFSGDYIASEFIYMQY